MADLLTRKVGSSPIAFTSKLYYRLAKSGDCFLKRRCSPSLFIDLSATNHVSSMRPNFYRRDGMGDSLERLSKVTRDLYKKGKWGTRWDRVPALKLCDLWLLQNIQQLNLNLLMLR